MKIKNRELFDISGIHTYIGKFEDKIQEIEDRMKTLESELSKLDIELEKAIETDILEASNSSKKELQNLQARKMNVESQLDNEVAKALKVKEMLSIGLTKLIPEAERRINEDLKFFNDNIERSIYKQLSELRQQQEELLLALQLTHNKVISEIFQYNEICNLFGFERYKKTASNNMFHLNLFMPNRSFPDLGSALLHCHHLTFIQDMLVRARAEANAIYNSNKIEKEQLPPAKTFNDIDLDKFLEGLNLDGE